MRKLILFMHTSLDSLVAGPNGEMDWIHVDEEIFDYGGRRINEADTALYGRVTYQMMESYWPTAAEQPAATRHDIEHSRWYKKVAKVVLSRSLQGQNIANTTIISDRFAEKVTALKQQQGGEIIMFGSPTAAHSLMQQDLIDDYWLFINPIVLGQGVPLFSGIKEHKKLKLLETNVFSSGVVCLHHERLT